MASPADQPSIWNRPAELLGNLLRFDTTNPPGREAEKQICWMRAIYALLKRFG